MNQLADSLVPPEEGGEALADLIDELTNRLHHGDELDADALLRKHPAHAEQLRELLPALQALARAAVTPEKALPTLGDFRLLRELGRGGMGIVHEAEQLSLGRRVALKVLPYTSELHPRQVQRFKNEATAAAALHHPHIVPVHAVGCEGGVHFFAMQLIDGRTLAAVIGELREQAAAGRPAHTSEAFCRRAAGLLLQAALALEYAHQGGVVHRDVKPANLMIDGRDWLWVTDFGLASCQGDPGLTGTGELPGTLRYMSPEQALGPRAVVDHRSDVYALGATLYELLTLEPACPGGSRQEVLDQIATREPRPPRRLNRTIPVDLETIVLKSLAREPGERYATAGDLADDLRRFLDDQPVRARRPSLVERGRRWLRRHQAVGWAAAAVAAVALVALTASTVLIARQRDEAETRQRQARQVVDRMYTDVAEKWLAQQPHLEPLQLEYLQQALEFYEDLMRQPGRDPELRLAAGQAARRVGDIRQKFGEYDRSEEAYARAVQVLEALLADHPDRADVRAEAAIVLNHRGNLLRRRGHLAEAHEVFQQARNAFTRLVRDVPDEPTYRVGLAGSCNNLGLAAHDLDRSGEAEAVYRQALALLRRLVADDPQHPSYRHDLAGCCNNLGYLLHDRERLPEADKAYQAAQALWTSLTGEYPWVAVYHQAEATCLHNRGALLEALGRPRKAEQPYREAMARRLRLAENFPRIWLYRQELATSRCALGMLLIARGRFPEAEGLLREAFVARNELAAAFPGVPEHQDDLAASHQGFGRLLAATHRQAQAEKAYREALALYERGPGRPGEMGRGRAVQHAGVLKDLGDLLRATGRRSRAEKAYRQALTLLNPLRGVTRARAETLDRLAALRQGSNH